MALHPLIKFLLAITPSRPSRITDYAPYRKRSTAGEFLGGLLIEKAQPVSERRRYKIPVEGGSIDLLVYRPFSKGPHPAHIFLHGGGWVLGSIDMVWIDRFARRRCVEADCVVVSVNYRKAPEHKFPIPLNDCHEALCWVSEHADKLGIIKDRLTVGGQSAGGNLAAALCLKVRNEGGPSITGQFLEVPALDLSLRAPSCSKNATGYGLTTVGTAQMRDDYLRSSEDIQHPYASPLLARDLSNLPPAFVMSAEHDPLHDDGPAYVKRLQAAGVKAIFFFGDGHTHGSPALTRFMASARHWQDSLHGKLKRLNQTGSM